MLFLIFRTNGLPCFRACFCRNIGVRSALSATVLSATVLSATALAMSASVVISSVRSGECLSLSPLHYLPVGWISGWAVRQTAYFRRKLWDLSGSCGRVVKPEEKYIERRTEAKYRKKQPSSD